MEIARHWRLRKERLRLAGYQKRGENGNTQVSISGSRWVELEYKKVPKDGVTIYHAEKVFSPNGRKEAPVREMAMAEN